MAQEHPKSSPVATTVEGEAQAKAEAEERIRIGLGSKPSGNPSDNPQLRAIERSAEEQAQQQRAEQSGQAEAKEAERPQPRVRRPAGPPPRRMSAPANDDLPSIGGLIYALQQRPSKSPFLVALIASLSWLLVGGFFAYVLVSSQAATLGSVGLLSSPTVLTAAVAVLVPIAIFWFLALLVWRAQELRLMASAMTEVAIRLAEPDKLAEQSVASLGQTIRRQVAAMNDAISRAIGRAGELEALVHNEVAALERSYSENEIRVRSLINELATEREALANNSLRVSEALKGVGAQVTREIAAVSNAIDKKLAERGTEITELLVSRSTEAAEQVERAEAKLSESVPPLLERLTKEQGRLTQIIENAAKSLTALDAVVGQATTALDKTLRERSEALVNSLAGRIKALESTFGQGAHLLDKTLAERLEALESTLTERAATAEKLLGQRFDAIGASFSHRTAMADKMLAEHTKSIETTFSAQAGQLQQALTGNAAALKQTAAQVVSQSGEAAKILTDQTQMLREVSRGLLEQIHSLTQRFENQGQAILAAARALDSSNARIDSILEKRHQAIIGLLETVNTKAAELDNTMQSYAGMVEGALSQAEQRAKQITGTLARDTAAHAQQALSQIERLREHAQAHTSRAVGELKSSFEAVMGQIGRQLEHMRGQFDQTTRGMRDTARATASDLDAIRLEMQRRMEALPQQTLQATAAMRKAISDQIKELESYTPLIPPSSSSDLYRQPQGSRSPASLPPAPYEQGRPPGLAGADDLNVVTSNLAQQLSGASHLDAGRGGRQGAADPWSLNDLLTRASEPETPLYGEYGTRPAYGKAGEQPFKLDDMARVIDQRTAAEVWRRYRSGERGILGRHLYSADGQATFDEITRRYERDTEFRATVDRYMADFERLLSEAEQTDPQGRVLNNYLMSETGRVYLVLAHASGRLR